jgi:hypothetical protein
VQRARDGDVIDVAAATGEEPEILMARHALPDEPGAARHSNYPSGGAVPL